MFLLHLRLLVQSQLDHSLQEYFLEGVNDFITTVCYETNLFGTLDVSNGSFSQTGTLPPTGAQIWSDFSRDPTDGTLYGIPNRLFINPIFM